MTTKSEINAVINSMYAEAGIEIAFPQHDIYLDTRWPLDICMVKEEPDPLFFRKSWFHILK